MFRTAVDWSKTNKQFKTDNLWKKIKYKHPYPWEITKAFRQHWICWVEHSVPCYKTDGSPYTPWNGVRHLWVGGFWLFLSTYDPILWTVLTSNFFKNENKVEEGSWNSEDLRGLIQDCRWVLVLLWEPKPGILHTNGTYLISFKEWREGDLRRPRESTLVVGKDIWWRWGNTVAPSCEVMTVVYIKKSQIWGKNSSAAVRRRW